MLYKKLREIEARKAELRAKVDVEGADLKALNAESEELLKEEMELRSKIEMAEKLKPSSVGPEVRGGSQMEKEKIFTIESPEYRTAWLKNLMGQRLTEVEERAAGATLSSDVAGAIPTQTMNLIIQAFEQNAVLYNLISVTQINGNVSFVIGNKFTDADWHGGTKEGTDADSEKATVTTVTLGGYELIKVLEISAKVQAMTISAFEAWIVQELAKKMMLTIEKAILSGTGTDQPTGILKTGYITQTADFTKAGMTFKDLSAILGTLPTGYYSNAVMVMPKEIFWNEVYGMVDDQKRPIVVADATAPAKYVVAGFPLVITENCPADTIIFGDFSTVKLNFSAPVVVESDKSVGFKSGKMTYRGLAVLDIKPTLAEAFVLAKRKSA